jgi:hypothetical protein
MNAIGSDAAAIRSRTPVHLWIVGVLALLWSLMGAFDYLATQLRLEFYMSQFTEQQLDYFYGFPAWAVAGWAIAVWAGLAGAVGLMCRRKWSVWAFAVSLAGMMVSSIYTLVLSRGTEMMGAGGTVFTVVVWAFSIFLLLYARAMATRRILR